jgi:hypothetical protein
MLKNKIVDVSESFDYAINVARLTLLYYNIHESGRNNFHYFNTRIPYKGEKDIWYLPAR